MRSTYIRNNSATKKAGTIAVVPTLGSPHKDPPPIGHYRIFRVRIQHIGDL